MSRNKGIASFSANFEPQVSAPLDAREIVETKADLLLPATWTANDSGVYTYLGMRVSVFNDWENNGIYMLIATDYTQEASWMNISWGGGGWDEIYVKHYWCDLNDTVNVYLWFKSTTSDKWRIRRYERATQIYKWATGETDGQEAWDDRTNLTYNNL